MVYEDYVSFETAKLLKEKGFDGNCYKVWAKESNSEPKLYTSHSFVEGNITVNRESVEDGERFINDLNPSEYKIEGYLAPTIQMAMKWLREVHKLYCDIRVGDGDFVIDIISLKDGEFGCEVVEPESCVYSTYEQACEAAIKYCLENLI